MRSGRTWFSMLLPQPAASSNTLGVAETSVLGTQNVVRAAAESGTSRLVVIFTDKAGLKPCCRRPTKRLAEMVVQANADGKMRVCSVRFGNVLGSRGSLLAVVREQMEKGEPVTVTDPDVTPFFMTVEEAVGLVLSAPRMAEFGERSSSHGRAVRIVDLVRGSPGNWGTLRADPLHRPSPGEKLHETLRRARGAAADRGPVGLGAAAGRPARERFGSPRHLSGLAAAEGNELVRTRCSPTW